MLTSCFPHRPCKLLAIALFSIAFLPSPARAQDTEREVAQALKSLSAPSQEVIQKLYRLRQLPADEWRFHAGDLEHGEAVDLDDTVGPSSSRERMVRTKQSGIAA